MLNVHGQVTETKPLHKINAMKTRKYQKSFCKGKRLLLNGVNNNEKFPLFADKTS